MSVIFLNSTFLDVISSIRSVLRALTVLAEELRKAVLKIRDLFVEVGKYWYNYCCYVCLNLNGEMDKYSTNFTAY